VKIVEAFGDEFHVTDICTYIAVNFDGRVNGFGHNPTIFNSEELGSGKGVWIVSKHIHTEYIMNIDPPEGYNAWQHMKIKIEEHGYVHLPNLEKL